MLFTPLHHAARKGFTEIAEYLLSQGVDVNIRRSLSPCSSFVFSSLSLSGYQFGSCSLCTCALRSSRCFLLPVKVLHVYLTVSSGATGYTPCHLAVLEGHEPSIFSSLC
jgi:ankyrin repeat protein